MKDILIDGVIDHTIKYMQVSYIHENDIFTLELPLKLAGENIKADDKVKIKIEVIEVMKDKEEK